MAYSYIIDPNTNCVFVTHTGKFKVDEEQHQLVEMVADPLHENGMNVLRNISSTALPEEYSFEYFKNQSRPQFEHIGKKLGRCKIAWILGNGRDYGLVLQWLTTQNFSSIAIERKPFRDLEPALKWLELPSDIMSSI